MKKLIIIFLLSLLTTMSYCQYPNLGGPQGNVIQRGYFPLGLYIPKVADTAHGFITGGVDSLGALIQIRSTGSIYIRDTTTGGHKWTQLLTPLLGYITLPQLNDTLTNFVRIQTQNPTATITATPSIYEFTSSGTQAVSLIWSSGRLASTQVANATNPLASIVIGGITQSFSQPSPGNTVGGTQSVTITSNTSTTLNNVTTTTDGKTATASNTISYENKIYAGFVTTTTPTSSDIIAATNSTYVGGQFSLVRDQSGSLTTPSSTKYVMFASPVSFGTPNIKINGLGITYTIITISFTNASGFVSSYYVAISPFPTAGSIDTYLVN